MPRALERPDLSTTFAKAPMLPVTVPGKAKIWLAAAAYYTKQ